jgi:hypothetical protein
MSHIRIDSQKALKKWSPVLENMGVTDSERLGWMSEYAEYHSINENAYVNAGIQGMGSVLAPNPASFAGQTINATPGSGDVAQNLLPVAMKIAAQTIGLDLVAVKPTPGPRIELLFIDFRYDDVDEENEGRPQVFKVNASNLDAIKAGITASLAGASPAITETTGGLSGGRIFDNVFNSTAMTQAIPAASDNKEGLVEFLGFSRIDGYPMFRAYRQTNAVGSANLSAFTSLNVYDQAKNTFGPTATIAAQIRNIAGVTASGVTVELVSALEDHIPGFSANWTGASASGDYPMGRGDDDNSYAGVIGPKVSTKSVAVGTIEVSSALRRTEIEDIKANTGMDITQKMESILVNELSQTISKQIVFKIFEMGNLNRTSAPTRGGASIFDYNTSYATAPGGETTHAYQRKLITKMVHASNFIATEGRVGPAQFAVTNGGLAASLMDIAGYTINPLKSKLSGSGQLYPVGQIGDITVYVDPYMKYNDNRIVIGRKNNPDQPGIIFVPYLMAQSISIISEATFAPRMLLRSRYAVTEVGWYPQKQYMTMVVTDANGYLN